MELYQYIGPVASFLVSGGLFLLLNFRKRARSEEQKLDVEEFDSVSSVIQRATQQISELAQKVSGLEQARYQMDSEIQRLKEENRKLRDENAKMEKALKRYFGHDKNLKGA